MSDDLFHSCYAVTMHYEGGFVSAAQALASNDPGGPTNFGVSLRAVVGLDVDKNGRLDFDLDGDGDVDEADIRALDSHPEKVEEFYRSQYWDKVQAWAMPMPWCLLAFDAAVNHGVSAAILLLQRALGVEPDGIIGPKTLDAINAVSAHRNILNMIVERNALFARIFLHRGGNAPIKGWFARSADIHIHAMASFL